MIYYQDDNIVIRKLTETDAQVITEEEIKQGWDASVDKYLLRLKDMKEQKAVALVAEYQGSVAGYVNLYFHAGGPFQDTEYPEIVDFGVLEKFRRHGIGSKLMDTAEKLATKYGNTVCLGVGLHSGYGSAQRMYVKRGYVPDGSGVWYQWKVCGQYADCCNDDELVLWLSKEL